ncbi:XAC0095 family protein [Pseudoxanthomonas indica]|uniref:XAC0095-like domain-containing protein n=1 Tax=Pseudoxanthomonas indica TaxID=428993 RepID=A0A1T5JWP2_9GAMM|nr:hypothetical protein [Pseudoxanthomonas indica]SKC55821.1 hypothetical protein SAMN06296058_1149 [Pseudoxanthomonas indica]
MQQAMDVTTQAEPGVYCFSEDTQLELIQLRDRMALYADMIAAGDERGADASLTLSTRQLAACFREMAADLGLVLGRTVWRRA